MSRRLLLDAAERGVRYLEGLDAKPVRPDPAALPRLAEWDTPMPAGPSDPAETLRTLDEIGSPLTMGMAGGRFFGFVIGSALPVTVAADWLATAWDQNVGLHHTTPAVSEIRAMWYSAPSGNSPQGKSARRHVVDKFSWHNNTFDLKHPD